MGVNVRIEPPIGMLDEQVEIFVDGVPPNDEVALTSTTVDEDERSWSASATFRPSADGRVDVARTAPLHGSSYTGVAPMGLLWSMTPDDPRLTRQTFAKQSSAPLVVELTARVGDRQIGSCRTRRSLDVDGVERRELDLSGVVGVGYRPPGAGPHPAVVVLGGSGGALLECMAALLASRGYAAVAVSYFGRGDLPPEIASVPLEPLCAVLHWLDGQSWVRSSRLGVIGASKGAEAALLLGVHVPSVRAVATMNGSGVHYQAITARGAFGPTWTLMGRDLDYLPVAVDRHRAMASSFDEPFETTPAFLAALDDERALELAAVPVERIGGPILMISGGDDRVWPSSTLAELVVDRMTRLGRGDDVTHVSYRDAGHDLGIPNLPATGTLSVSADGGPFRALGGTAAANAQAETDAWSRLLEFLDHALGGRSVRAASVP